MEDNMLEKCPACFGAKRIMKLGMNYGSCKLCNATGKIKTTVKIQKNLSTEEKSEDPVESEEKEFETDYKKEITHYGKKKKHRE